MSQNQPKEGFNLSKWALDHPALTRYLMVVLMLLGFAAYFQLGQDEDPPFTFRVMVVRTYWPGATAQQVAEQVTDKIERTLQEVPYADKIRSYSKPGESQIIFQIKDSSRPNEVANIWYTVRKKVGDMRYTLPTGVQGPFFNDEFCDVYGVIYALESEGFSYAELKTFADDVRQQLLRVRDVAKVEQFGVQDEKLFVEISQKRLSQLGLDFNQVLAQLGQQDLRATTFLLGQAGIGRVLRQQSSPGYSGVFITPFGACPTHQPPDPCHEFAGPKGFEDIVVYAQLKGPNQTSLLSHASEHDHRRGPVRQAL